MQIIINGFIYHKTAERYADCFDRYGVNTQTNKFAISDGVSKSFFPGIWADLLIDFFIKNEKRINIADIKSYKLIQDEWIKRVGEIVNKPNQKYFVRNFFIQGRPAAATFVGLHFFEEGGSLKWEAFALGDSFLFFVPSYLTNVRDTLDNITYLSSKKDFEFNNFPDFFDSRSNTNKGKIRQKKNELKSGTFYLMTDALSEWFISEKQRAMQIISEWKTQSDFEQSIISLRKQTLQNDDSAILIIKVVEDNSDKINYKNIAVTDFSGLLEIEKGEVEKLEVENKKIQKKESTVKENSDSIASNESQDVKNKKNELPSSEYIVDLTNKEEPKEKEKGFWKKRKENWEKQIDDFSDFIGIFKKNKPEKETHIENESAEEEQKKESVDNRELKDTQKEEKNEANKNGNKDDNLKGHKNSKSSDSDEDISSITDKF